MGWRDPFIFETGGDGREWGMLLGSGLKGKGGAVLIYRSASLYDGVTLLAAESCGPLMAVIGHVSMDMLSYCSSLRQELL